jgi:hypothetical protein
VAGYRTCHEIAMRLTLSVTALLDVAGPLVARAGDGMAIPAATSVLVSPERPVRPTYRVGSCIDSNSIRPAIPRAELAVWSRTTNGEPCGTLGGWRCEKGVLITVIRPGWIRWDTCDGMPVDTFVTAKKPPDIIPHRQHRNP